MDDPAAAYHKYSLGVVGNCSYVGYIDTHTDVRWLCMPRFDSPFLFGSLLDSQKGGHFYIQPEDPNYSTQQHYIKNTNILVTEVLLGDSSRYRVTDFAPRFIQNDRAFRPMMLFRKIEVLAGVPRVRVVCEPRADWGEEEAVVLEGSNHIRFLNVGENVRLTSTIPVSFVRNKRAFVLTEDHYLCFSYGLPLEAPLRSTGNEFLSKTTQYWQRWIRSTSISLLHQEAVIRSALVLKLHQYEDTGGIIASGTTSLPEFPGSGRTWDYRYCWLRDSYYTLAAFNSIGHFEESERYFTYIENILHGASGRIQPIYTIDLGTTITEKEINLQGYLGNGPVRIGNAAYDDIQNDVYGQILMSLLPIYTDHRLIIQKKKLSFTAIDYLLTMIEKTLDEPDAGIWEFRGVSKLHTYTFLFHWLGSQAAVKIARQHNQKELLARAEKMVRESALRLERCYDPKQRSYTQGIGQSDLDASALQLLCFRYLDPRSEKATQILKAIEKELLVNGHLMYRYLHIDDFGKPQSTFLVCSFWFVEALALNGQLDRAFDCLGKLLKYTNHLGLLSEDIGLDGSQWGNFPQTYSHVGLINAVNRLQHLSDRMVFE